jgi:hypothetical protein
MAYNFLSLVNDVNDEFNEIRLTEANFDDVDGYYAHTKRAVNAALKRINQTSFEWPFNHVTQEDPLVAGQTRYSYPMDAKSVNFDSFRVKDRGKLYRLTMGDYEEYLDKYVDADINGLNHTGTPSKVYRSPDLGFVLYPAPRADMELVYEYYSLPIDLVLPTDTPYIPEQFRHIIVNGAVAYVYKFRGDVEGHLSQLNEFKQQIKEMRTIYQNRYEEVRSTYIPRQRGLGVRVVR